MPTTYLKETKKTKNHTKRMWLALVGVIVILFTLGAGIFIVQKQNQQKEKTYAPNAPASKPKAAIPESNVCHLTVNVHAPSKTPTPTSKLIKVICEGVEITPRPAQDGQKVTYTSGTRKLVLASGSARVKIRYLKDGKSTLLMDTPGTKRSTLADSSKADKIHFATIIHKEFEDGIARDCISSISPTWNSKIKKPISTGLWIWYEEGEFKKATVVDGYQCQNSCLGYVDVLASSVTPTATPSVTLTATPSATPTNTPTLTPTPNPECNALCESDAYCQESNNTHYICYQVNDTENRCRLDSNPTSKICAAPTPTPTPTATPTPTNTPMPTNTPVPVTPGQPTNTPVPLPTSTPTQVALSTPAPGCNDICETNADCDAYASYICYQTTDGSSRCRLDSNPESINCTALQPTKPATLPNTGPGDWAMWLKAGLATLGVGAALLLLL